MNLDKVTIGSAYCDPLMMPSLPPKEGSVNSTLRTLNNSQISKGGRQSKNKFALGYKNNPVYDTASSKTIVKKAGLGKGDKVSSVDETTTNSLRKKH